MHKQVWVTSSLEAIRLTVTHTIYVFAWLTKFG